MIKNIFKPLNKNLKLLLPIEVKNVSLKLNDSFFFKKISLKIDTKLISCFIGPNGAGKTSCIKLLTGLTKPNSGEILFSKSNKIPTEEMIRKLEKRNIELFHIMKKEGIKGSIIKELEFSIKNS